MKIPVELKIAALIVATCGFYTYVGHLVPQKEIQPPAEVEITQVADLERHRKILTDWIAATGRGRWSSRTRDCWRL